MAKENKEYKDLSVKFSNRLRELIDMVYEYKQQPVNCKEVAIDMDITPQGLSHYMSSSRLPRLDICIKMINYFSKNLKNFNPDYLLLRSSVVFKSDFELDKYAPGFSEKAYRGLRRLSSAQYSSKEAIDYLFSTPHFVHVMHRIQRLLLNIKKNEIPRLLSLQEKYNDEVFDENNYEMHKEIKPFYAGIPFYLHNQITGLQTKFYNAVMETLNYSFAEMFKSVIQDLDKGKNSTFYVYDNSGIDKIEHIIPVKVSSSKYIKFLVENYFTYF